MLFRLRNLGVITSAQLVALRGEERRGVGRALAELLGREPAATEGIADATSAEARCRLLEFALDAMRRGAVSRAKLLELAALAEASDQLLRRGIPRERPVDGRGPETSPGRPLPPSSGPIAAIAVAELCRLSVRELMSIPGVGPDTAARIVDALRGGAK